MAFAGLGGLASPLYFTLMRATLNGDGTAFRLANPGRYTCSICSTLQTTPVTFIDLGAIRIMVRQCMHCAEVTVSCDLMGKAQRDPFREKALRLFPEKDVRPPRTFTFCSPEVDAAYREACELFHVHTGASGAYARRALELLLDNRGYKAKTLAAAIDLANSDLDPAKVLPKRLLMNLSYIKEIGNFALHIRRDEELAIISVGLDEVNACIEIIEELIDEIFQKPAEDLARIVALNVKLEAAGKRPLSLPQPLAALSDLRGDDSSV